MISGRFKHVFAVLVVLILQACTTPGTLMGPAADDPSALNPATESLLQQANASLAQNQLNRASELIERAIRISPRSPFPYEALAQVRYKEGRYQEANTLIKKGTQLARAMPDSRQKRGLMKDLQSLSHLIGFELQ